MSFESFVENGIKKRHPDWFGLPRENFGLTSNEQNSDSPHPGCPGPHEPVKAPPTPPFGPSGAILEATTDPVLDWAECAEVNDDDQCEVD